MAIENHPRYSQLSTLVTSLIEKVRIAQATYYTQNQRYFQGIRVPDQDLDGVQSVAVNWNAKPSDQEASYATFDSTTFRTNFRLQVNIQIDIYHNPLGWGWFLRVALIYPGLGPDIYGQNGSIWRYVHHEGPDNPVEPLDHWYIFGNE